jgi:hypothetical protein
MAISITQQPTSPNLANNNLVYEVTSSLFANPQYQYICDIKSGSALIQRIKQQPNPSGFGVFDIGMIVNSNVGPADKVWVTPVVQTQTTCAKQFTVLFGEEYGTSVSSSVQTYNGIVNNTTASVAPAKSGSNYYYNLDGTLDPNDKVNWNWPSSSKYHNQFIDDLTFNYQVGLTDMPATQSVRIYDWATISTLNGNLHGAANNNENAQDIYAMVVNQYDITGSLLIANTYYNVSAGSDNGGPRANPVQRWADVYTSQSQATRLIHWPVGPRNIDEGPGLEAGIAYYTVTFYEQGTDTDVNPNGVYGRYRFDIVDPNCGYDGARFAWKNKYGVWDYYTFPLAQTTIDNIERQTYKQTFVNFSTTTTTVSYDRARRGDTQFVNKINKNRTAETDWIDQELADAMLELFYSTDVYMQDQTPYSGIWLPIVVNNATLTEKTNPRTQKLFKYTIEFTLANDTQNRL